MGKAVRGLIALGMLFSLTVCGKIDIELQGDKANVTVSAKGANVSFALSVVGAETSLAPGIYDFSGADPARPWEAALFHPLAVGEFQSVPAQSAGLASLKLHFNDIQICQEVTMNGTASGESTGCLSLYRHDSSEALNNTREPAVALQAAIDSDEGFIDVMDSASRASLVTDVTVSVADAHEYNYGVISIAGPVKATATMIDPADGTTPVLYTKKTAPGKCMVNNQPEYDCAVATSAMTAAPAEEATFIGMGGGALVLKFQKPLVITAEDVANETAYQIKLAFNPNGLLQGVSAPGATNFPPMADKSTSNGISNVGNTLALVGAQMAAVFYPDTAKVMRESYSATVSNGTSGTSRLRIEFYYRDSDADKAIYGVSTALLPTADTRMYLIGWERIYGITDNSDGTINLLDYQGAAKLSDFARVSSVGAATTGSIVCDQSMDCTEGGPYALTFTLDALEELD